MNEKEQQVAVIVEKMRPYIQSHGGDVALLSVTDAVARISVSGTCVHCPLADLTYNKMMRKVILEDVPGITDVIIEHVDLSVQ